MSSITSPSGDNSSSPSIPVNPSATQSPEYIARRRKQAGFFFGGACFVVISSLITRRALGRRYAQSPPLVQEAAARLKSSLPNRGTLTSSIKDGNKPSAKLQKEGAEAGAESLESTLQANGPLLAVEALTIATMNVFSWAVMATGGALWYFDISTVEDLRRKIRGGMGVDGTGRTEADAEEEMEEWLATVLARKESKRKAGEPEQFRNERGKER